MGAIGPRVYQIPTVDNLVTFVVIAGYINQLRLITYVWELTKLKPKLDCLKLRSNFSGSYFW